MKIGFMLVYISFAMAVIPMSSNVAIKYVQEDGLIVINTPDEFSHSNSRDWSSIGRFLKTTHYSTYVLNWGGLGGSVELGQDFIADVLAAENQGKKIIINMIGNSYSMHSLVVCYASKVINKSNKYLMFHADAYTRWKKELRSRRENSTIQENLNYCVSQDILPSKGLEKLWQGYEVYVNKHTMWYVIDDRELEPN